MKKSLIALAVLAASGAAMAQSSVTVYGRVDLSVGSLKELDKGSQTKLFNGGDGGLTTSRLGFRGTEDLGGGLYAGFWIEGALNPDTGTSGGQTWQRRSTVSLSSPWGEARLGRDNTVTYYNTTTFDPFGDSGLGAAGNLTLTPPAVPVGGAVSSVQYFRDAEGRVIRIDFASGERKVVAGTGAVAGERVSAR